MEILLWKSLCAWGLHGSSTAYLAPLRVQQQRTGTHSLKPSGSSCSPQALRPDVKVFAAEPCNADDCYQSKVRGELTPNLHPPDTIADAVKTSIGPNTWPIIRDLVDDVLTVSEEEIKVNAPGCLLTVAASRQLPPSMLCPSALPGQHKPLHATPAVQHPHCLQLERAGGSSALPSQSAAERCAHAVPPPQPWSSLYLLLG